MQTVFKVAGRLHHIEDAEGQPTCGPLAELGHSVFVEVKYELRTSPQQALVVDIYSRGMIGFGQTKEKLVLDNGVELIGRTLGGESVGTREDRLTKMRMVDIEQDLLRLDPVRAVDSPSQIDTAVFGVVSSEPLGHGSCANGLARPGYPFSFSESGRKLKQVSTHALRLRHDDIENHPRWNDRLLAFTGRSVLAAARLHRRCPQTDRWRSRLGGIRRTRVPVAQLHRMAQSLRRAAFPRQGLPQRPTGLQGLQRPSAPNRTKGRLLVVPAVRGEGP